MYTVWMWPLAILFVDECEVECMAATLLPGRDTGRTAATAIS